MTARQWGSLLVGFLCVIGIVAFGVLEARQEKHARVAVEKDPTYPKTHQWTLAELTNLAVTERQGDNGVRKTRIMVVDTAGVCLYVAQSAHSDSLSNHFDYAALSEGLAVAMVAVPKTQLKPGVGCQ
jgi:hypothetical protein